MCALILVRDLKKWFSTRRGYFSIFSKRAQQLVRAVDGITFEIKEGEVFCLAGESGCGKTTTGRLILRLIEPTSGEVYFRGVNIFSLKKRKMRMLRSEIQMIFQDPYESLDPRMNVFDIVAESLEVNNVVQTYREKKERVFKVLKDVRLVPVKDFAVRFPHELSGGQRQRVAIARVLALNPKFIVADEPVSMLDASVRIEVLNTLANLHEKYNLACLYITHDLAQARYVGNRLAVMYLGKIMEMGPMEKIIKEVAHPYTKALISNVPIPDPTISRQKFVIKGETPTPINVPSGCSFHPRCPYAKEICRKEEPEPVKVDENHYVTCHMCVP